MFVQHPGQPPGALTPVPPQNSPAGWVIAGSSFLNEVGLICVAVTPPEAEAVDDSLCGAAAVGPAREGPLSRGQTAEEKPSRDPSVQAASRQSYRRWSPPTRGIATTFALGDGRGVTDRREGVSLLRPR